MNIKKNKILTRTSTFSLKFSNQAKQRQLRLFMKEYIQVVNFYIDKLWEKNITYGSFLPPEIRKLSSSWLAGNAKQCAGNQALKVVKQQKRNKVNVKPIVVKNTLLLSENLVCFLNLDNSFDEFIKFWCLGNKIKIVCPLKYHSHYKKLLSQGFKRKKSVQIREYNGNLYLDVFLEKEFVPKLTDKILGVDIGIKKMMVDSDGNKYGLDLDRLLIKIQKKKQGSKAFCKALIERNNYINKTVKELPECHHVFENLKGIGKNTKKRLNKTFRSKFSRWTYGKLLKRIQLRDEVVGVQCHLVTPAYTSQTCNQCGFVHKSNRTGELFLCGNCGHTMDADFNASKNILNRFLTQVPTIPVNMKASVQL